MSALRCEDCHAEIAATEPMLRQVREASPVFHDGCEFGRGFGIWREAPSPEKEPTDG